MAAVLDLLVAGGGPVGLATALYAAEAGLAVAVVEPRAQPVDKACGEGLMPGAVAALRDLGVAPHGRPFLGIRYIDGVHEATADFRRGTGLGVRRTTLQASLAAAVTERGIPVHAQAVATRGAGRPPRTRRRAWRLATWPLPTACTRRYADWSGWRGVRRRGRAFGLRRHFAVQPWADHVEVHWARDLEAYVTPVDDHCVGVALLTGRREPFDVQLRHFPALRARLPAGTSSAVRGAGPLRQHTTGRVAGRVLLVGDAAGYVDALTGEGIAVGLASARALVDAVVADDAASYERAWKSASRSYRWLTQSLLLARHQPALARLIVPGAQHLPRIFERRHPPARPLRRSVSLSDSSGWGRGKVCAHSRTNRVGRAERLAELEPVFRDQLGVVRRSQLRDLGWRCHHVDHEIGYGRWQLAAPEVVVVHNGPLTYAQRLWVGILHAGPTAAPQPCHHLEDQRPRALGSAIDRRAVSQEPYPREARRLLLSRDAPRLRSLGSPDQATTAAPHRRGMSAGR
ncbi:MAG: FAD-dependent monooxygenase [Nocardioidaceae bacterium]